jgi:hypothetical protein
VRRQEIIDREARPDPGAVAGVMGLQRTRPSAEILSGESADV